MNGYGGSMNVSGRIHVYTHVSENPMQALLKMKATAWIVTSPASRIRTAVVLTLFALLCMAATATAQDRTPEPDTLRYDLAEIEIQAARDTETEASAPFSVSVKTRTIGEQGSNPAFSFDQVAAGIPGLWVNDRQNYALGERVSIRGMGWRTAFGVRGIYVLLDDVPLTVPDGQTVMDILDPAMVRQIEVVRGPSSFFWGNAGGGTLFLSTRPASFDTSLRTRIYGGAFGTYSAQIQGTHREGPRGYHLNASWLQRDGYRDHSQHQVFRMTGHMNWDLPSGRGLQLSGAFVDAPDTRHPGSLSATDLQDNRRQAAALFENASAGKAWRQGQLGLTLRSDNAIRSWQATVYGTARSLHNPLPFADIEVDRLMAGTRFTVNGSYLFLRLGIGLDGAIQSDDRRNFGYTSDFERGARTIDQQETVLTGAISGRLATDFQRFNISTGMRVDAIRFENEDRLLAGGEDRSGSRSFTAVSPSVGLSLKTRPGLLYASFGTSFETPTTTELVNRPDMTGGFNPDIDPERATGLEAGLRGGWTPFRLRYEIALFRMNVRDQLISYRTEQGGDRDFYRNAGKTRHDGLEISLRWQPLLWVEVAAGYNLSRFTFRESVSGGGAATFESGNSLPGIPGHRFVSSVALTPGCYRIALSSEVLSSYYADNANTASNPGFEVFHLNMGHDGIAVMEHVRLAPFLTVNNLTNARYNSSVSINANFGRYYEPAPGRALYAGFRLDL